ncbi:Acyl CoA oxidase [Komagataella phaffii CBS 7435]|uniref:Acyl CoA oxidase n=1 Tax=Komagataella phaffii (strain ATCC 76273 / CBS 7435 / CECT 11047 / NRRL Y-11430 / Wegner 21-1) TaxID=981350 RepID=F2QSS4_KOMPC|nr:GQ67_00576T0 [Komagataella phaffii]AOA67472.1 GQ68_00812T0 [Komagataella phaffii GS115]CAH2448318.1 Oxidoreductase [Komagataella phaffii CBS 7435]CCA38452.1 Acyl CoA oxidase [Komagataella phaffii CBS 7435]
MSTPLKVVDISTLNQGNAKELLDAAVTQGFLYIDGHDFSSVEVEQLFNLSSEFFKLDTDTKEKFPIDSNDRGYTAYHQEMLDPDTQVKGDPKEAFNFGDFDFHTGKIRQSPLPEIFEENENRRLLESTSKKLYDLSIALLKLLAMALEIDPAKGGHDWFLQRHLPDEESITTLRFLRYPSVSSLDANEPIRAGAHTDYGTVTLLFQQENQEGLELYLKNQWQPVPYIPSKYPGKAAPIIVNIADQLSYWTCGLLKSTMHRVKFPSSTVSKDRYSIVFFVNADNNVVLEPIPSPIVSQRDRKITKLITSKEYLDKRFAATYVKGH